MQNLVQMVKTDPENTRKLLKPSFVNFIEGNFDHLLFVYVEAIQFLVNVDQNHSCENKRFRDKQDCSYQGEVLNVPTAF